MPATLVIAPPAAGKTAHCVERIRDCARHRAPAPIWAVLPDRIQVRYFRRRLAEAGGALGVRVGTFGDLYRAVLDEAGRPVPEASLSIIYRLVGAAISDSIARGAIAHYAAIAGMPGFTESVKKTIGELKSARVRPADFLAECGGDPRLHELGQIYAAYQARLARLGWADPEGLNWLAVEALEADPDLVADWALVLVDGFDDFEIARRDTLVALSRGKPELVITLPGSPGFARPAHQRFRRAYETLTGSALLRLELKPLPGSPRLKGAQARIEQGLFEPAAAPSIPKDQRIAFVELVSPAEEAREALRWVKARHLRDGVKLRDCLIVTPEPERYRPLLREAAAEFGLPIAFTEFEPLISTPAATALAELLDLPRLGYPHRLLADTLRSPYFRLPAFEQGDADALEAVSRAHGVAQGQDRWLAALERLAAVPTTADDRDGADDEAGTELPHGARAARLREAFADFAARLDAPAPRSSREWVAWLEDLLEQFGYMPAEDSENPKDTEDASDDPAAKRDRAVFEALGEVLRALVVGDVLVGGTFVGAEAAIPKRDYAAFVGELRGLLETVHLKERVAEQVDYVLVTKVLESRGPRFAAVTMVGLSEGLFPQVETEDLLLDEGLRERLGLEPRLGREQRALFYLVATRAERWLRFSRPYLSERGETWAASPYWRAALDALGWGEDAVRRLRPDDPRALQDAASAAELLFWLVRRRGLPGKLDVDADVLARYDALRHARDVLGSRLAQPAAGPYEGDASDLAELLGRWYGPHHTWSPSRLESYGPCGLRFFTESLLGLEEASPPEPGPDARQLGTLLHAILEAAYRAAADPGDPEAVITALRPIAAEKFAAAPEEYGFEPTAYWQAEAAAWREQLERTVRELDELPGHWQPVGFEVSFGRDGAPPLLVEIGDSAVGTVRVRGVIDRVDRDGEGNLRVIDYKTGGSHLAAADLIAGRRLQLPLYAMAAREDPALAGTPVEGLYWSIRSGTPGSLRLSRFKREHEGIVYEGPEGAMALARLHVARAVEGVRGGRFAPRPPAGGCPEYCAARAWCWRYVAGF